MVLSYMTVLLIADRHRIENNNALRPDLLLQKPPEEVVTFLVLAEEEEVN